MKQQAWAALGVLFAAQGCGYEFANTSKDSLAPFSVAVGAIATPNAPLAAALADGARAELARRGSLEDGAFSEVRVDLLRVDEEAEGVVARAGTPLARAARVTVRGRAQLYRGGKFVRDTGDMSATEVVAAAKGPLEGGFAASEGGRLAARRLGGKLVRRILGLPDPGDG